jgi:hypothetical protein
MSTDLCRIVPTAYYPRLSGHLERDVGRQDSDVWCTNESNICSTAKGYISIHLKTACICIIMKKLPATFAILVFSGLRAVRCLVMFGSCLALT